MLKLNLILNGLVSSLDHAVQGDTLVNPYHKSDDQTELRQFDYVVSNPPFKMDFSESRDKLAAMATRFWGGVPKTPAKKRSGMAIYSLFVQHVVNSLKDDGKGAIVVPTGFLTAKTGVEKTVLHRLVDDRVISGAVSMPSNVFANTGTNVSVIFLDKSASTEEVVLIDASRLGEEYKEGTIQKRRLRPEEIELIIDTFRNRDVVDDLSVRVTHAEIVEKSYSLAAGQYFKVKIDYVPLSEEEFKSRLLDHTQKLHSLFNQGAVLQEKILDQMEGLRYE